jgi:hypothetical protein
MSTQKPKNDPRVRAKLEELGADAIRAKLVWIMNVRTLAQQDDLEPLGDDVRASRRQMQEWLTEKDALMFRWVKAGVILAGLAALFALASLALQLGHK